MPETVKAAWIPYGRTLHRLRNRAGLTCRKLAHEATCNESLISKIERGRRRVSGQVNRQFAIALERFIPGADLTLTQAHQKAQESSQHSWYNCIADLEAQADTIQIWEPLLVPGIFQTPGYATTVFGEGRPQATPEQIAQFVQARQERARVVLAKETWSVMDETALYRAVGSHQVMAEQLSHLISLSSTRHKITIVPQGVPYCGGLNGSVILLSAPGRTAAYVEHIAGGDTIIDPDEVARISAVWREISAWALSPAASVTTIKKAITWHQTHKNEDED